jgi:hypothetical protein
MGTINRFEIDKLRENYKLGMFLETGTLHGGGVESALNAGFENIISIEIEPTLAAAAKERFNTNKNIDIIEGDSSKVIKEIVNSIQHNTLFWLDAHFPGADIGIRPYRDCLKYDYNTRIPLEVELTAIAARQGKFKDVIIADDLWVYKPGVYGAGEIDSHCMSHGHNITRAEIIEGRDPLSDLYKLFEQTHNIKEFNQDQGYMIFLPK